MQINPNSANIAQQAFVKNNTQDNEKVENNSKNIEEAVSLDINSSSKSSLNDLDSIKEKIAQISGKLEVNYAQESKNFSKNNVNFFEGSFLTAQSTNIKDSVIGLLSE